MSSTRNCTPGFNSGTLVWRTNPSQSCSLLRSPRSCLISSLPLDVAQAFYDQTLFDRHEVNAAHGVLHAVTPPVTPANDRPVLSHKNVFEIEVGVWRSGDRLPQRHARFTPDMPCAIGRRRGI